MSDRGLGTDRDSWADSRGGKDIIPLIRGLGIDSKQRLFGGNETNGVQPERIKWLLVCIMPQVQDQSLDPLPCSSA